MRRATSLDGAINASRPEHRFADVDLLTEDIACDRATKCDYASSVHRGTVIEVTADGQEQSLRLAPEGERWGVFALGIDTRRHLLRATLAALPACEGYASSDSGRSAIVAYDLRRGQVAKRMECPRDGRHHLLGDMTVTADGTVWVSDSETGALDRVAAGDDSLEVFCPPGTFESPQTPALAPDGKRLYVADYARGIGIVDLATRTRTWMGFAPGIGVQGIDGLYRHGRELIGVQNGTRPERITRFRLDDTGTRAIGYEVLEQSMTWLGDPTHGVVRGDEFVFIANSGWDRVDRDGMLHSATGASPPQIRVRTLGR